MPRLQLIRETNIALVKDIRTLIDKAKENMAQAVNSNLVLLYWSIGKRITAGILQNKRADYGEEIVSTLSAELTPEYGQGFSPRNLWRMLHFSKVYFSPKIVVNLSQKLGWSHFVELLRIQDELKRNFYTEMCRIDRWSVRTLREKIGSMLYERTALSKKPEKLAKLEISKLRKENRLTPDLVFKDPYNLSFLGLTDFYKEKDLESAILRQMELFILELGVGFSFVSRQKRISIGHDDFYLDLLFYHRKLRRLVAIELKLDKFKAEFKGQMELYLRWLDKHERGQGEEAPIGLILCAGKCEEQIALLELEKSGIRVAEYITELPSRRLLEKKLHDAIQMAKNRFKMC